MLVGRCSSELSSHKLQAKSKKSQAPSEADSATKSGMEAQPFSSVIVIPSEAEGLTK